jgi:hypothetical protein
VPLILRFFAPVRVRLTMDASATVLSQVSSGKLWVTEIAEIRSKTPQGCVSKDATNVAPFRRIRTSRTRRFLAGLHWWCFADVNIGVSMVPSSESLL